LAQESILDLHLLLEPLDSVSSQPSNVHESVASKIELDLPPVTNDLVPVLVIRQMTFVDLRAELRRMEFTSLTHILHYLQQTQHGVATAPNHPVDG
jgi:hypothetical protein